MKPLRNICLLLLMCLPVLLLAGCGKRVDLAVASMPNVNPDHSGRPSPIIVKMYEMRSDLAFKQADFQTLFDTPMKVLGADLLAADELVFVPGEARTVSYEPMSDTRFVGIVGGFRQMERAQWRQVVPVDAGSTNTIQLEMNDTALVLVEGSGWKPEERVRQFQERVDPQPSGAQVPKANPTTVQGGDNRPQQSEPAPRTGQQGYATPRAKRAE